MQSRKLELEVLTDYDEHCLNLGLEVDAEGEHGLERCAGADESARPSASNELGAFAGDDDGPCGNDEAEEEQREEDGDIAGLHGVSRRWYERVCCC